MQRGEAGGGDTRLNCLISPRRPPPPPPPQTSDPPHIAATARQLPGYGVNAQTSANGLSGASVATDTVDQFLPRSEAVGMETEVEREASGFDL